MLKGCKILHQERHWLHMTDLRFTLNTNWFHMGHHDEPAQAALGLENFANEPTLAGKHGMAFGIVT